MRNLLLSVLAVHISLFAVSQITIKMKREGGVSTLPCKVNGLNLKFIFDTGASDVSISMTEATFMLKNDYLNIDDILGKSNYLDANGNLSEGININLREIEIGGLKLFNVKASVVSNLKAPLLLGQSAISKLGVIQLDLVANTLTILTRKDSADAVSVRKEDRESDTTVSTFEVSKSNNEMLLEEANNYYEERNYQQCISNCNSIISEDPKNENAYILRALSYDMLEDYNIAIKDYTKAIELNPKNYITFSYRGKSKYDIKDYTGALADLNKGIALNPKYIKGFVWRAETKVKLKNYVGAIQDYDKAVALDPLDSLLYVGRAGIKRVTKDYKGAIVDCNKAIDLSSGYAQAYYYRGISKKEIRDYNGAMSDLNMAIELDPNLSMAYEERGGIKENQYEDFDGALEDYKKALEVFPGNIFAEIAKNMLENKIKNNVWIKVGSTNEGDNWYIYNSIVSKEYSTLRIWVKNEFKKFTAIVNGKSTVINNGHSVTLCLFNCDKKEYKIIVAKYYNTKGKVVHDYEDGEYQEWKTPAPQTIIDLLLNEACERYN